ncbi:MAG: sigma-54-dependent transcriptional regulator [Bacteriovoracia bacterium]
MKPRVLVVDDEDTIRNLLKSRLEREGHEVTCVANADEAEKAFTQGGEVGVMVTDIKMPGKDGFELMKITREKYPQLRVIVITGHGEKEMAVRALRQGAADYLEKPFDLDQLSHAVRRAQREYQLERDNKDLVGRLEARVERVEGKQEDQYWFVSKAQSMNKVNEWITVLRREAMRGEAEEPSVLIQGESGTGKEGIARMVHAGSSRAKGPWVAVNCANFSEQLLESELFGHERGAFTGANAMKRGIFEIAKGGTLFLDELGEMDVKLQAKLLRVLQEKVFRRVGGTADLTSEVRVIAATNRDLQERVKAGAFREDLYHRLSRVVVEIPALRERSEDIAPMATQFAERAFRARGKTFGGFTPDGEEGLRNYGWPGNVRELLNVIERVALVWQGTGPVNFKALALPANQTAVGHGVPHLQSVSNPYQAPDVSGVEGYMGLKKKWCDSFEREYLITALNRNGGNVSAAAREAKLDRSNFLRLLRRHGLKAMEYRKAA